MTSTSTYSPLDKGKKVPYNTQVIKKKDSMEQEEYLSRCVVDPTRKVVYIYSSEGSEKQISCDTTDQFMNVLNVIRSSVDEEILAYVNPL